MDNGIKWISKKNPFNRKLEWYKITYQKEFDGMDVGGFKEEIYQIVASTSQQDAINLVCEEKNICLSDIIKAELFNLPNIERKRKSFIFN